MNKWILTILLLLVAGCAQIKHRDIQYTRYGSQKLGNVYMEIDPNGVSKMWIGQQKSDFQLGFEFAGAKLTAGGE